MKRQILKATVPFVEGHGNKPRPVVQLSSPTTEHRNFQVAYITSKQPPSTYSTDIEVNQNHKDFGLTGLSKTSFIRASKIFTINASVVQSIIGDLPDDVTEKLNQVLKVNLKLN